MKTPSVAATMAQFTGDTLDTAAPELSSETDMDREFRQQMGAETKKPKLDKFSGRTIDVWVKVRKDNHAFDLAAQQVCAAMVMRILPNPLDLEDAEKEKAAA